MNKVKGQSQIELLDETYKVMQNELNMLLSYTHALNILHRLIFLCLD